MSTPARHMPHLSRLLLVSSLMVLAGTTRAEIVPAAPAPAAAVATAKPEVTAKLPKLLDLGATKCIPCKKMAPILDALKADFAGRLEVEFIDVWVNPKAAEPYDIGQIPTQIFYDAAGKEQFRHVGFFSREDILAKWKELGVALVVAAPTGAAQAPAKPAPEKP